MSIVVRIVTVPLPNPQGGLLGLAEDADFFRSFFFFSLTNVMSVWSHLGIAVPLLLACLASTH